MPQGYTHLTYEQRCQISALMKSCSTQKEIAEIVDVDQSTISREIFRNKGKRGYRPKQACAKAVQRRKKSSSVQHKMTSEVILLVEQMIREHQFSPEQVSGTLKLNFNISISPERVYLHIWEDKRNGGTLYKNLRRAGKKYNKRKGKTAGRGLIPNRVGIENRPHEVEQKLRVGDGELDTIVGANHRGAIVSMVDRKTKLTMLRLITATTAGETANAIIDAYTPIKDFLHTLTADNGKEFAYHENMAKALGIKFYFARPYHSWERGLNENTNGLVRQYFPKKTDFTKLTQEQVLAVETKLNNRPRKTLGYRTPNEEFLRLTGSLPPL